MQNEPNIDLTRIAAEENEQTPEWPEAFGAVGGSTASHLARLSVPKE